MKVQPDWMHQYTGREAEEQLEGFKFLGTGWYLDESDTLLVLPAMDFKPEQLGLSDPMDMEYVIYCWNVPFEQTIFGNVCVVRSDARA